MPTLPYSEFSFDQSVSNLTGQLAKTPTWSDTYRSSTGQTLIELFSMVGDNLHYGLERAIEEAFLDTAKLDSSTVRNVKFLNYKIKRKFSAVCTVRFSVPSAVTTFPIVIPRGTTLTDTSRGLKFIIEDEVRINIGQSYVDTKAVQGALLRLQ
jgi:hypothetical protein